MTSTQRTCFVISPIGPEGSETRISANDFLELLVEPALEKYGFAITRADQIANPTAITTDIVRLVQEADLCLVDLTNSNPNVFYECGRRHETGKPFIQLVRREFEGKLPFDVAGIRTITYDVSTPRASRESVLKLQSFIDSIISAGFKSATGGESLSSIAQGIERIERKLTQMLSTGGPGPVTSDEELDLLLMTQAPPTAFMTALRKGRFDKAYSILDRIKKMSAPDSQTNYLGSLKLLAATGYGKSFELLDFELQDLIRNPNTTPAQDDILDDLVQGIAKYFTNTGKFSEGIEYFEDLHRRLAAMTEFGDDAKAVVANKVGLLAYSIDRYDLCIKFTKMAVELSNKPSFLYNLALVYKEVGKETEFKDALESLAKCKDLDEDHRRLMREFGM